MMIETKELKLQFDRVSGDAMEFGTLHITDKRTGTEHCRVGVLLVDQHQMLKKAEGIVNDFRAFYPE